MQILEIERGRKRAGRTIHGLRDAGEGSVDSVHGAEKIAE